MKKNEGFTLIELLAVILVLSLLSVLIIPKLISILSDSEKNANMSSAQNLVKSAQLKVSNNEIKGTSQNIKINYKTKENINYLDYTGEKPEIGQVQIKTNGDVAMAVKFGDYCYLKSYNSNDITTIEYDEQTCGANSDVFINYTMPELAVSGEGLYESATEPNRYIYIGSNPNNYIYLKEDGINNTLYRIISYEPDGTIKVIRDVSIGDIAWDKRDGNTAELKISGPRKNSNNTYCNYNGATAEYYGCNVWGTQSNTYYNDTTLSNLNQEFFYKYYPSNTTQSLQNFTNTGTVTQNSSLNDYLNTEWTPAQTLDNYIAEHSFNVGGIYYDSSYTGGDKGLSKEKEEQNSYTWNGKIGLMNITDYVETSLNPTCTSVYSNFYYNTNYYKNSTQTLTGYDNWPCSNRSYNWMSKAITEWSLSPSAGHRSRVWYVSGSGYFNNSTAYITYGVRPVFYLKSSVKLGGLGTIDNPYYIVES